MIRVFQPGNKYGDPYTWTVTCRFLDLATVELIGAVKPPTVSEWRATLKALADMGVTEAVYRKYKGGQFATRRRNTTLGNRRYRG